MSTFYLLPHRSALGDHLADSLSVLMPGLDWNVATRRWLADLLTETLVIRENIFVVSRDDLPPGISPEVVLVDGFGAEPGDEVVEVLRGARPGEFRSRRWRIGESQDLRPAA